MATKGISGTAIGVAVAGGLLVYAGVTDQTLPEALRSLVRGEAAKPAPWIRPEVSGGSGGSVAGSGFGSSLANQALKYLGRPYVWGGTFNPPNGGGDCSGLVWRSMRDLGVKNFPRVSSAQLTTPLVRTVKREEVAAGDLVGWIGAPGHIGVALDNKTGVFSPRPGSVVQRQEIDRTVARISGVYVRYVGPTPSNLGTTRSRGAE